MKAINDALLKGLSAQELVYAVNILYNVNPSDKSLLSVANKYQHTYLPTIGGFKVARDIARGEAAPITYRSSVFRDGRKGDEGGIAVIRSTDSNLNSALTLKATSHGLSHGHFDKLTMAYYDRSQVQRSLYPRKPIVCQTDNRAQYIGRGRNIPLCRRYKSLFPLSFGHHLP